MDGGQFSIRRKFKALLVGGGGRTFSDYGRLRWEHELVRHGVAHGSTEILLIVLGLQQL